MSLGSHCVRGQQSSRYGCVVSKKQFICPTALVQKKVQSFPNYVRHRYILRVTLQDAEKQDNDDVGWEVDGVSTQRTQIDDGFNDQVVQISRVSKTVKGGRQISFRAVIAIGDGKGMVGVGCASAKEISTAVQKANVDARRRENMCQVPLSKGYTFPHQTEAKYGGARVMLKPAGEGTGVIAGGAIRTVLELAGVKNALAKMMGSNNPLNNARATMVAFQQMKTFKQVAEDRDVSIEYLFGQPEAMEERKRFMQDNYKQMDAAIKNQEDVQVQVA